MAKGVLPDSDSLSLYTIGLQTRDYATLIMEQADVVIALGYDFVEYATCFWNAERDKRIIHVDVSPAEVDEHYIVELGVLGAIHLSLGLIEAGLQPFPTSWAQAARKIVIDGFDTERSGEETWPLRPQHILRDLRIVLDPDDQVICDVGATSCGCRVCFPAKSRIHALFRTDLPQWVSPYLVRLRRNYGSPSDGSSLSQGMEGFS
jgi:acetolactate synthase-1/2/3 large subunit